MNDDNSKEQPRQRPAGVMRMGVAVFLLVAFLSGYATAPVMNMPPALAQLMDDPWLIDDDLGMLGTVIADSTTVLSSIPTCVATPPVTYGWLCVAPCSTSLLTQPLLTLLQSRLESAGDDLRVFISQNIVDGIVAVLLNGINQTELNLIDWWDTFWYYNLHPAMQDMTEQFQLSLADQVRAMAMAADTQIQNEAAKMQSKAETADGAMLPSENVAVVATMIGGQQRQSEIAEAVRHAQERRTQDRGLNMVGTPAARDGGLAETERHNDYDALFCDPASNNGVNNCATTRVSTNPALQNADTQPTRVIMNRLTINVDSDDANGDGVVDDADADGQPDLVEAVDAAIDNMLPPIELDPIPEKILEAAPGQERYLERRSLLARDGAMRSATRLSTSWRMPGTQIGQWVDELRQTAGVPPGDISSNPSYREVMHAMVVDRFNNGKYGMSMLDNSTVAEKEKLVLNSLTLMQLRDYHELLQRTILTLAVQVSLTAEEIERSRPDIMQRMPQ